MNQKIIKQYLDIISVASNRGYFDLIKLLNSHVPDWLRFDLESIQSILTPLVLENKLKEFADFYHLPEVYPILKSNEEVFYKYFSMAMLNFANDVVDYLLKRAKFYDNVGNMLTYNGYEGIRNALTVGNLKGVDLVRAKYSDYVREAIKYDNYRVILGLNADARQGPLGYIKNAYPDEYERAMYLFEHGSTAVGTIYTKMEGPEGEPEI